MFHPTLHSVDPPEEARKVSKALFGSRYRLEVAAAVAAWNTELLYAREVARALGLSDNLVQIELRRFEAGGLLFRLDRVAGQQQQYFQRLDSDYWDLCVRLLRQLSADRGAG